MSRGDNLIASSRGTPAAVWRASVQLQNLPRIPLDGLLPRGGRLVVVAPHPDDEVLTCGGLLASLAEVAPAGVLISVTDGEGSHPGSLHWTSQRLRNTREMESRTALTRLDLNLQYWDWQRLRLPDSRVDRIALAERLHALIRPRDQVISTWRHDGHRDHEATALACTDADSSVSEDWLVRQLAFGAEAVCGTVRIGDWSRHTEQVRQLHERRYQSSDGHRHIHGANLGICARAYQRVGGFRPLAADEDVHLVRDLERSGARIVWTHQTCVTTSARRDYRAHGGFGAFLQGLTAS